MASSCSPDLLCLLPSLSDHALPLQRKTKAPTVRWIWSTITQCCRGLIYLAGPIAKNSPQEILQTYSTVWKSHSWSIFPATPPSPPAEAQTWKSLSRAGTNSYIPPCPAPADIIPGQHTHGSTSFPKPCKSDSQTKNTHLAHFQNPWSPLD